MSKESRPDYSSYARFDITVTDEKPAANPRLYSFTVYAEDHGRAHGYAQDFIRNQFPERSPTMKNLSVKVRIWEGDRHKVYPLNPPESMPTHEPTLRKIEEAKLKKLEIRVKALEFVCGIIAVLMVVKYLIS